MRSHCQCMPSGRITPHFMAFSALTELNSRAMRSSCASALPSSAWLLTATPMRKAFFHAAARPVACCASAMACSFANARPPRARAPLRITALRLRVGGDSEDMRSAGMVLSFLVRRGCCPERWRYASAPGRDAVSSAGPGIHRMHHPGPPATTASGTIDERRRGMCVRRGARQRSEPLRRVGRGRRFISPGRAPRGTAAASRTPAAARRPRYASTTSSTCRRTRSASG